MPPRLQRQNDYAGRDRFFRQAIQGSFLPVIPFAVGKMVHAAPEIIHFLTNTGKLIYSASGQERARYFASIAKNLPIHNFDVRKLTPEHIYNFAKVMGDFCMSLITFYVLYGFAKENINYHSMRNHFFGLMLSCTFALVLNQCVNSTAWSDKEDGVFYGSILAFGCLNMIKAIMDIYAKNVDPVDQQRLPQRMGQVPAQQQQVVMQEQPAPQAGLNR